MDYTDYRPAPEVLDHVRTVDFVAAVGPTAAGKTTLIKAAVAQDSRLHMLVSGTSRPARAGEQDGYDFHFGAKEVMTARAAAREYVTAVMGATGDLYTTAPEDYPADNIAVMAVLAHAIPLFRALPYHQFSTIFIVPPDPETWRARLAQHSFSPDELARRLREAEGSLAFALQDKATRFVVNGNLATATEDFMTLALGSPLPPRLLDDQKRARHIIRHLLKSVAAAAPAP